MNFLIGIIVVFIAFWIYEIGFCQIFGSIACAVIKIKRGLAVVVPIIIWLVILVAGLMIVLSWFDKYIVYYLIGAGIALIVALFNIPNLLDEQIRQSNNPYYNYLKGMENAKTSQRKFESDNLENIGETNIHNEQTEIAEVESSIEKFSLREDVDDLEIKPEKRNRKLQVDTKLVRKLFKDAGTVLDKSKTDAIANTLADRYEVTNPKYRELLSDKLYAYYTYVARDDTSEAQTAIYGYEMAQDIAAMSEVIKDNTSDNFFDKYGVSIYDVIFLDIAKEYAEKTNTKVPKELGKILKKCSRKIDNISLAINSVWKKKMFGPEQLFRFFELSKQFKK